MVHTEITLFELDTPIWFLHWGFKCLLDRMSGIILDFTAQEWKNNQRSSATLSFKITHQPFFAGYIFQFGNSITMEIHKLMLSYTPANEVAGVYSDPYVCPFLRPSVHLSVCPSQSLIRHPLRPLNRISWNSGIVHYKIPYCTSYFKFLSAWFWGFPEQNKDFAITTYGGGTHL